MRKIISILLIFSMLSTIHIIPVSASTVASGTCGENLTWTLDDAGMLTIKGTGDMEDFSSVEGPWYNNNNIKKVVINSGVTSIGSCAFYSCENLSSISIPYSVQKLGRNVFNGTDSLKSINLPNRPIEFDEGTFWFAYGLENIVIPDGVIGTIGFDGCRNLKSVQLPDLPEMPAFAWCSSLEKITIPESVTEIPYGCFYGCSNLKTLIIHKNLTKIDDVSFDSCNISNIYYTGSASEWNSIDISSVDNDGLESATISYNYSSSTTITYNANGGNGAPSSQTKIYGQALNLSNTAPAKFGYTFLGWATDSALKEPLYLPGDNYYNNSNTTLYAVWSSATNLSTSLPTTSSGEISVGGTLRYFKFTPSTSGTYIFESTLSEGDSYGYLYNSSGTELTKNDDDGDGSNFKLSYNLTAGTTYYFGVKYYSSSTTGTIPVKLSNQATSCTITYNYAYNGGTSASKPSAVVDVGSNVDLSVTATKSGWEHIGWNTDSNATSGLTSYTASGDTTLYAIYRKTLTGSFYYGNSSLQTTKTVTIYNKATSGSITIPSLTGYSGWSTDGWRDDTTASSKRYSNSASVSISSDTKFYGIYSRSLTLSYNANGGDTTPSSESKTQYYNASGNKQSVSFTLASAISKSGATFSKWAKGSTSGIGYSAGSSISISDNTTMYATWNANSHTLTYSANGGSGAPSPQDGTTLTISSTIPTDFPRTFLGWSKSGSATSPGYLPGGTISLTGDTTLYAVWSDATTLSTSLPTTSSGEISVGGTYRYFKFTPSTLGTYIFESTLSEGDSYGYLYNSGGSQLAYNDDGGSENGNTRNFKISYELTSGTTYYFAAKYYGTSTTGTIPVKLSKQTLKVSTPTMQATNIMGGKRIDISCSTSGATIYYTTNGTTPTTSSTKYTGSFNITTSGTITVKAIAVCNGYEDSDVASANFSLSKVSTPTASPSGGTITSSTSVSLSCATNGATIYYTTNGNTPTTSSTKYTGAITISSTTTLKAVAVVSGYVNSECMTCEYTYQDAKQFTMLEDNYRFYNRFDSFGYPYHYEGENRVSDYRIPRERYISVYGPLLGPQKYDAAIKSDDKGLWGGSCFGMASSCGMFYMDYLNYNLYDSSADNLFEIAAPGSPNKGLTILIEKYQLVQSNGAVLEERIYNATDYKKANTVSQFQKIINAVKYFEQTGNNPIVLAVRRYPSGGHAVFPYKVTENADGSYYIYVYDNNDPYGTDNKVYISSDLKSFNYLNKYTRNMTFTYIDTINKVMNGISLMSEEDATTMTKINVFINADNPSIMTTDGVLFENIEGAFEVEVDDDHERTISEYVLPIGDYMITANDANISELNVSVANDYDYQDISTNDTNATIFIGVNKETHRVYAIISSDEHSTNTIATLNSDGISNIIESEGMILGVSPISNEEVNITSDESITFDGNMYDVGELDAISTLTSSVTSSTDECYIEVKQSTLSKLSNGISGNLSLNVINKTGDILDSNMYVALYDEAGKLLSLFTRDSVLYNGTNYINLGSLNYFGLSGNKFKLKIMLWDGTSTMKPISNALEIEIK